MGGKHEKAPQECVGPQTQAHPRVPPADEYAGRQADAQPSQAKGALAAHPGLTNRPEATPSTETPLQKTQRGAGADSSATRRLKHTQAFRAVYRRGRWARGTSLSVGALPNAAGILRIGLRTRRGLKGAVARNRLKRQLRAIVGAQGFHATTGLDLVVVIHPPAIPQQTAFLKRELRALCTRLGILC